MKISVGDQIRDQDLHAVNSKASKLSHLTEKKPLVLIFHRFYGCLLAQYDLHRLVSDYQKISDPQFHLAFVMQTPVQELEEDKFASEVPFTLVSDMERKLYEAFRAGTAGSKEELLEGTQQKLEAARAMGLVHGNDTGEPLQLPAAFILDSDLKVIYAYYCRSGADLPELADILQHLNPI